MAIDTDRAADLLIKARHGAPIDALPEGSRPATIEDAYAIQDRIIASLGEIGGWKVGEQSKGGPIVCAPLATSAVRHSGAKMRADSLHDIAVEIEFAFRLEHDFPATDQPYTTQAVLAGVSLCPLIEVIATRFVNKRDASVLDRLADTQSSGVFVVGTPVRDWRGLDLTRHEVVLMVDGSVAQNSTTISPAGDPVTLLVWQVNHCIKRSGGMRAGDVVTTGALAGATSVEAGNIAEADFGTLGRVSVTFL